MTAQLIPGSSFEPCAPVMFFVFIRSAETPRACVSNLLGQYRADDFARDMRMKLGYEKLIGHSII